MDLFLTRFPAFDCHLGIRNIMSTSDGSLLLWVIDDDWTMPCAVHEPVLGGLLSIHGSSELYPHLRPQSHRAPLHCHVSFPLSQALHDLNSSPFTGPCPRPVSPSIPTSL